MTIVCIACLQGCVGDFNNPADPKNNGGFYGGIDPKIAGTWDEISPLHDSRALACGGDSFVYKSGNFGPTSPMNARDGQVFAYYANATEPFYIYDYSLSAEADTLYMVEDNTSSYTPPLSVFGYTIFVRSH
jgi:hypothetical protein